MGGGAFLFGTLGLACTGRSLSSSSARLLSSPDPVVVVCRYAHLAISAPYTLPGLVSSCVAMVVGGAFSFFRSVPSSSSGIGFVATVFFRVALHFLNIWTIFSQAQYSMNIANIPPSVPKIAASTTTVTESTFDTWDQPENVVLAKVDVLFLFVYISAVYGWVLIDILLAMKLYVKLKVLPVPMDLTTM